jgi:hypothetical protein
MDFDQKPPKLIRNQNWALSLNLPTQPTLPIRYCEEEGVDAHIIQGFPKSASEWNSGWLGAKTSRNQRRAEARHYDPWRTRSNNTPDVAGM